VTTADAPAGAPAASRRRGLAERVVAMGLRSPSGDARLDKRGEELGRTGEALLARAAAERELHRWLESVYTHARAMDEASPGPLAPRARRLLDEIGDLLQAGGPDGGGP